MGWNGIGIGWPNASAQATPAPMGYFIIAAACNELIPTGWTSQLINTDLYNTGDYVDGVDPEGNPFRYLLGEIVENPGDSIMQISGPVYNSCEVNPGFTGYFGFQEYCSGAEQERTYYGPTTQTWQVGQVVRNTEAPFADNYVIILSIVPDLGGESYPMTTLAGPALDGCPIP